MAIAEGIASNVLPTALPVEFITLSRYNFLNVITDRLAGTIVNVYAVKPLLIVSAWSIIRVCLACF